MEYLGKIPELFRHKSGQGCFKFKKKFYYCGKWPEDKKKAPPIVLARFASMLRTVLNGGPPAAAPPPGGNTVAIAINAYWDWAKVHRANDYPEIQRATTFLLYVAGTAPLSTFGPRYIVQLQENLIGLGYTRQGINKTVSIVKTALRWCVSREYMSGANLLAIETVRGLEAGQTNAPESIVRKQVSDEVIKATLEHLPPVLKTMVELQRYSGMRPGEVCKLTTGEIDRSEKKIWWYVPKKHKNAWRGSKNIRVIGFGPKCQKLLEPWLRLDPDQPLFSPKERMAQIYEAKRQARKTKVQPSQINRAKADPIKPFRDFYSTSSYCRAIAKVCKAKDIEHWSPNQLRKRNAQTVLESQDLATAADMLGHSDPEVTRRHYLESSKTKARAVVLKMG